MFQNSTSNLTWTKVTHFKTVNYANNDNACRPGFYWLNDFYNHLPWWTLSIRCREYLRNKKRYREKSNSVSRQRWRNQNSMWENLDGLTPFLSSASWLSIYILAPPDIQDMVTLLHLDTISGIYLHCWISTWMMGTPLRALTVGV